MGLIKNEQNITLVQALISNGTLIVLNIINSLSIYIFHKKTINIARDIWQTKSFSSFRAQVTTECLLGQLQRALQLFEK